MNNENDEVMNFPRVNINRNEFLYTDKHWAQINDFWEGRRKWGITVGHADDNLPTVKFGVSHGWPWKISAAIVVVLVILWLTVPMVAIVPTFAAVLLLVCLLRG
jgi:hypothetical protein